MLHAWWALGVMSPWANMSESNCAWAVSTCSLRARPAIRVDVRATQLVHRENPHCLTGDTSLLLFGCKIFNKIKEEVWKWKWKLQHLFIGCRFTVWNCFIATAISLPGLLCPVSGGCCGLPLEAGIRYGGDRGSNPSARSPHPHIQPEAIWPVECWLRPTEDFAWKKKKQKNCPTKATAQIVSSEKIIDSSK